MTKLTAEQKQERKEARAAARKAQKRGEQIAAEMNQKPVKSITISVEWKKNRVWGWNPNAEAQVHFQDGTFEWADGFKTSGCGYDKLSTVIGQVFNRYMRYALWQIPYEQFKSRDQYGNSGAPYGMHAYSEDSRSFGEGVGVNCYFNIAKALGGTFECVASGKTFDVYKFTMEDK